jgi:integrase
VAFYLRKAGHLKRVFEMTDDGREMPFGLARLDARDVDDYISRRRREGAHENTIAKELVTLRAALKIAKRRKLWLGDIAAVLPVGFAPEYKPRERFLTPAELQRLLAQLTPDRAARVAFVVATSACRGESDRARPEDVADDLGTVHIRGTKRRTRRRTVHIVLGSGRDLLRYALNNAEGEDGLLFRPWPNVGRDLPAACARAKIPRCSPNDLRRTFAHWLKDAGIPNELVAPEMGHTDTRMVERVYGRLSEAERHHQLAVVLGKALAPTTSLKDCNAGATDTGESAGLAGLPGPNSEAELAEKAKEMVPRGGIEPPTRGFSVPCSTN